jgi:uracil-DNA glycosylase
MKSAQRLTLDQKAKLDLYIEAVKALPSRDGLMNPYSSRTGSAAPDSQDEIGAEADEIRVHNLRVVMTELLAAGSDVLMCGEAPGHLGARQSGYAFSSEREIASGRFPFQDCRLLAGAAERRRPLREEPSALYMWRAIDRMPKPATFTNACPLHPHQPGSAYTNRTPKRDEVRMGQESLARLIDLVQPRLVIAVGRTAERALKDLGVAATTVRHPSYGGAPVMLQQLEELGVITPAPPSAQQSLF